jgi:hypothetical protein
MMTMPRLRPTVAEREREAQRIIESDARIALAWAGQPSERKDAARFTVEAIMYELREFGIPQLDKPNCQRRLCDCSPTQLREIITRLNRLRPKYPNINDDLISNLKELLP